MVFTKELFIIQKLLRIVEIMLNNCTKKIFMNQHTEILAIIFF